jgi:hypothetical protein
VCEGSWNLQINDEDRKSRDALAARADIIWHSARSNKPLQRSSATRPPAR